jgi:hypothetical protein
MHFGLDIGSYSRCLVYRQQPFWQIVPDVGGRQTPPSGILFVATEFVSPGLGDSAVFGNEDMLFPLRLMHDFFSAAAGGWKYQAGYFIHPTHGTHSLATIWQNYFSLLYRELAIWSGPGEHALAITAQLPPNDIEAQSGVLIHAALAAGFARAEFVAPDHAIAEGLRCLAPCGPDCAILDIGSSHVSLSRLALDPEGCHPQWRRWLPCPALGEISLRIAEALADITKTETASDPRTHAGTWRGLLGSAEEIKNQLVYAESIRRVVWVAHPETREGAPCEIHLDRHQITRFYQQELEHLATVLRELFSGVEDIPEPVWVTGGASLIPGIKECANRVLSKPLTYVQASYACAAKGALIVSQSRPEEDSRGRSINPLSVGIVGAGDLMDVFISRGALLPQTVERVVSTQENNQTSLAVSIVQGERLFGSQNRLLGEFDVLGIMPAPAGRVQVRIRMTLDPRGLLHVIAAEEHSQNLEQLTVTAHAGLTAEAISRMLEEARGNLLHDREKRRGAEIVQQAERTSEHMRLLWEMHRDRIGTQMGLNFQKTVNALQRAIDKNQTDMMELLCQRLNALALRLGESLLDRAQLQSGRARIRAARRLPMAVVYYPGWSEKAHGETRLL